MLGHFFSTAVEEEEAECGRGTSYRIDAREKPSHPQTPSVTPIASPNLVPPGQVRTNVAKVLDVSLIEVVAVEIKWCPVC